MSPVNDEQMSIQDHFLYTNAWQQREWQQGGMLSTNL